MTDNIDQKDYPVGLRRPSGRATHLRQALSEPSLVVAPGAYDCITARLVATAGFQALYIIGSGISMSRLGAPDVGLMSFTEVLDQAQRIADVVDIPVIADADTGYGGPLNVIRAVRDLERAGVAAIQIEDQDWPKRCGHEAGRRLVDTAEMVGRLKAAVDARMDQDLVIIARTDARASEGMEAALERAEAYREAGADVIFFEAPENEDEMARVPKALAGTPCLINLVEGGRTPILPADRLEALGYAIAIFPNAMTRMVARMGQTMMADLKQTGTTDGWRDRMLDHRGLWDLFDYPRWMEVEGRFTELRDPGR